MFSEQAGTNMNTIDEIKKQIEDNAIILYMKGSPKMPQCGFSARAVQCIEACGVNFATVDILANPDIRQTLPQYANWPTFPQLFVKGELLGGSDIIAEMYEQGELEPLLQQAVQ
jgi:monothiol glutaredoxin